MSISPSHTSIGQLFERQYIFQVPKYQRSYAWEESQINDFMKDILKCYEARTNGTNRHHFFGGVVCILQRVPGSGRQQQDLVDGQQRISTFMLLVLNIIDIYLKLSNDMRVIDNTALKELIESRIEKLRNKYLFYRDEINRRPATITRLTMSKVDDSYFKQIIEGLRPKPTRGSHIRILNAYTQISNKISILISEINHISDKIDALKLFEEIIDNDCTVIHIETDTKAEAYRLFQVLNDRGTSLTDGDLLRSSTLELLDSEDFLIQQNAIENAWDEILKDNPNITEEFLRCYYASYIGVRPGSTTLFDDFFQTFFSNNIDTTISIDDAEYIKNAVYSIKYEYEKYAYLIEGEWPYVVAQPITPWDCDRLYTLLIELKHSLCIPLLMAACKLEQKKFAEIVTMIELFIFRYKSICNNHVGSLGKVYLEEAVAIRNNPDNYNVNSLRSKLKNLQVENADDEKFKLLLKDLRYQNRSNNKLLKYFLITIEYYLRWYRENANGSPKCRDKSRILSFVATTIEHIYPQNAHGTTAIASIEHLKNDLGNLTILGPEDNNRARNVDFETKKQIFQLSPSLMNREIAKNQSWTVTSIEARRNELLEIANKTFRV